MQSAQKGILFTFKGRDKAGGITSGTITAKDRAEAASLVRDSGVVPLVINEKRTIHLSFGNAFFGRVKLSERILFAKNLSGMLKAGLSLSRALEVLHRQTKNVYFKSIITTLLDTVAKGGTLSEGLTKYPRIFSTLFVAMVRSGEESGGLPQALVEVCSNLEKTYTLRRKIKGALMYPMIIVCAIVIIGILMFIYVVPTLVSTFKELNAQLPTSTKIIIAISDLVSNHLLLLVLGLLVIVALFYVASRLPTTKRWFDFLSTRIPVVGGLVQEVNTARTTRTLSSLIASGVDISRSIAITKDVLQNYYYKKVLDEAGQSVQKGEPISEVFKKHSELYPVMVGEMIEVGEETGKITSMLSDIATFYEEEVDARTKNLSTIIEPVMMIFVGAGVGFFAVSMLSPMYSIMDSIK